MVKLISGALIMENEYKQIKESFIRNLIKKVKVRKIKDAFHDGIYHYNHYIEEYNLYGVGSSKNEAIAFLKSQNELLERLCFFYEKEVNKEKISTNGFATHENVEKAKKAAYLELVERDIFFSSWLAGKKPEWKDNLKATGLKNLADIFLDFDLKIQFGIIGRCGDYYCLISSLSCLKKEKRFGASFALSVGLSPDEGYKKLILDQHRMGTLILNSLSQGETFNFKKNHNEMVHPLDHTNYYLNPNNFNAIKPYLTKSEEKITLPKLTEKTFIIYKLPSIVKFTGSVVRCISCEAQQYFTGKTTEKKINKNRIFHLTDDFQSLNYALHPLG